MTIKLANLYPKQFIVEVKDEEEEKIWDELYGTFKIRCRIKKWKNNERPTGKTK